MPEVNPMTPPKEKQLTIVVTDGLDEVAALRVARRPQVLDIPHGQTFRDMVLVEQALERLTGLRFHLSVEA